MNIRLLNQLERNQKMRRETKQSKTNEATPRYTFNIRDDKQIRFGRNSYKLSSLLDAQMNQKQGLGNQFVSCNFDANGYFHLDHGYIVSRAQEEYLNSSQEFDSKQGSREERRRQQVDVIMNKNDKKSFRKGAQKSTTTQTGVSIKRTNMIQQCESNRSSTTQLASRPHSSNNQEVISRREISGERGMSEEGNNLNSQSLRSIQTRVVTSAQTARVQMNKETADLHIKLQQNTRATIQLIVQKLESQKTKGLHPLSPEHEGFKEAKQHFKQDDQIDQVVGVKIPMQNFSRPSTNQNSPTHKVRSELSQTNNIEKKIRLVDTPNQYRHHQQPLAQNEIYRIAANHNSTAVQQVISRQIDNQKTQKISNSQIKLNQIEGHQKMHAMNSMTCTITTDSVTGRPLYAPKYIQMSKQKQSDARSDDQSSQMNSSLGRLKGSVPTNIRSTEKPLESVASGQPQSPVTASSSKRKPNESSKANKPDLCTCQKGVQSDLPSPRQTPSSLKKSNQKKNESPAPIQINKKPVIYKSIKMQEFTFEQTAGEQPTVVVENLLNSFRERQSSTCSTPRRDTCTFNYAKSSNNHGAIAVIDDQQKSPRLNENQTKVESPRSQTSQKNAEVQAIHSDIFESEKQAVKAPIIRLPIENLVQQVRFNSIGPGASFNLSERDREAQNVTGQSIKRPDLVKKLDISVQPKTNGNSLDSRKATMVTLVRASPSNRGSHISHQRNSMPPRFIQQKPEFCDQAAHVSRIKPQNQNTPVRNRPNLSGFMFKTDNPDKTTFERYLQNRNRSLMHNKIHQIREQGLAENIFSPQVDRQNINNTISQVVRSRARQQIKFESQPQKQKTVQSKPTQKKSPNHNLSQTPNKVELQKNQVPEQLMVSNVQVQEAPSTSNNVKISDSIVAQPSPRFPSKTAQLLIQRYTSGPQDEPAGKWPKVFETQHDYFKSIRISSNDAINGKSKSGKRGSPAPANKVRLPNLHEQSKQRGKRNKNGGNTFNISLKDYNAETLFLGMSQQLESKFSNEASVIKVSPLSMPMVQSDENFERTDSF